MASYHTLAVVDNVLDTHDPIKMFVLRPDFEQTLDEQLPCCFAYGDWDRIHETFRIPTPPVNLVNNALILIKHDNKSYLVLKADKLQIVHANVCKIAIELNLPIVYCEMGAGLTEFVQRPVLEPSSTCMKIVDFDYAQPDSKPQKFITKLECDKPIDYLRACQPNSGQFLLSVKTTITNNKKPTTISIQPENYFFAYQDPVLTREFNQLLQDLKVTSNIRCNVLEWLGEILNKCRQVIPGSESTAEFNNLCVLVSRINMLVYDEAHMTNFLMSRRDIEFCWIWQSSTNPIVAFVYNLARNIEGRRWIPWSYSAATDWIDDYFVSLGTEYTNLLDEFFASVVRDFFSVAYITTQVNIVTVEVGVPIILNSRDWAGVCPRKIFVKILEPSIELRSVDMLSQYTGYIQYAPDLYCLFSIYDAKHTKGGYTATNKRIIKIDGLVTHWAVRDEVEFFYITDKNKLWRVHMTSGDHKIIGTLDGTVKHVHTTSNELVIYTSTNFYSLSFEFYAVLRAFGLSAMNIFTSSNCIVRDFCKYTNSYLTVVNPTMSEKTDVCCTPVVDQEINYTDTCSSVLKLATNIELGSMSLATEPFLFINGDIFFYKSNYYIRTSGFNKSDSMNFLLEKLFSEMIFSFDSGYCQWLELIKLVFKKFKFNTPTKIFVDRTILPSESDNWIHLPHSNENIDCYPYLGDEFKCGPAGKIDFVLELLKLAPAHIFTLGNGNLLPKIVKLNDASTASADVFSSKIDTGCMNETFVKILQHAETITVVGIVGQQSGGKSYLLNRLFGTQFDVAAQRCTDGVWMSVSRDEHGKWFLIFDCEGLFSSVRNVQEELKMLAFLIRICDHIIFNTSISNNRNYFELIKRVASLLSSVVCVSDTDRKACANFVIRDLDHTEAKGPVCELSSSLSENIGSIKTLFARTRILYIPSYKSENFQKCVAELKQNLFDTETNLRQGKEILEYIRVFIIQLYVTDNVDTEKRMVDTKLNIIFEDVLKMFLNDGKVSLDAPGQVVLRQFQTFYRLTTSTQQDKVINQVKWTRDETHLFGQFVQDTLKDRIQATLTAFKERLSALNLPLSEFDDRVKLFESRINLLSKFVICKGTCRKCTLNCMSWDQHTGDCDCRSDHKCGAQCGVCAGDKQCDLMFGHASETHLCSSANHNCDSQCMRCLASCRRLKNHSNAEPHSCLSRHFCCEPCSIPWCNKTCVLDIDMEHEKHLCNRKTCGHKCVFSLCEKECTYPEHCHDNTDSAPHICDGEHVCEHACNLPGAICDINYTFDKALNSYGTEFEIISQTAVRDRCKLMISPKTMEHAGHHICIRSKHRCLNQCNDCLTFCDGEVGHDGLHRSVIHRNKDQCMYIMSGEAAKQTNSIIKDAEGNTLARLGSGDDYKGCAAETCVSSCKKQGRGHYHAIECLCEIRQHSVKQLTDLVCQNCDESSGFYAIVKKSKKSKKSAEKYLFLNFVRCASCKQVIHYTCLDETGDTIAHCRNPSCLVQMTLPDIERRRRILLGIKLAVVYPGYLDRNFVHCTDTTGAPYDMLPCAEYFVGMGWEPPVDNPELSLCAAQCNHYSHETPPICSQPVGHKNNHVLECTHETISAVQLAIVCDATGSMFHYMSAVSNYIENILNRVTNLKKINVEIAVVFYKDHPPEDNSFVTKILPFSKLPEQLGVIKKFIAETRADGGGDGPEAVLDGINEALKLDWKLEGTCLRTIILLADAPPHGADLYGMHSRAWSSGCPCKLTFSGLAPSFKAKLIQFRVVDLANLRKMCKHFSSELAALKCGHLYKEFFISSPEAFIEELTADFVKDLNSVKEQTKLDMALFLAKKRAPIEDFSIITKAKKIDRDEEPEKDAFKAGLLALVQMEKSDDDD